MQVQTAAEMRAAVFAHLDPATVIIKCAAVADFRPVAPAESKIKKTGAGLRIDLEPTPDILAELGAELARTRGKRLLIGFAAETQNLEAEARRKLESKHCDMVVANLVGGADTGFNADSNEVLLVLRTGETIAVGRAPKREIARQILDQVAKLK